jgi:hypothetical protein
MFEPQTRVTSSSTLPSQSLSALSQSSMLGMHGPDEPLDGVLMPPAPAFAPIDEPDMFASPAPAPAACVIDEEIAPAMGGLLVELPAAPFVMAPPPAMPPGWVELLSPPTPEVAWLLTLCPGSMDAFSPSGTPPAPAVGLQCPLISVVPVGHATSSHATTMNKQKNA